MGRAKDGQQVKEKVSFRVEPKTYLDLVKDFGSFTEFVNDAIKKYYEKKAKAKGGK